ncbi:MAG: hypothetical protein RL885_03230 [Planctomycetota bacterium]
MQSDRLRELLTVRLLIAPEKGVVRSTLKRDLKDWFDQGDAAFDAALDEATEALVLQGQAERPGKKYLGATAEGRAAGLRFLGISSLPPKLSWAKLKSTYLIARALELPPPLSPKALQRIGTVTGLRAAILRKEFALPIEDYPTLIQARDALAWKQLGRETSEVFSATKVLAWALSQQLPEPVDKPNDAVARIAITKTGARNAKPVELRNATIRTWVRGGQPAETPETFERPSEETVESAISEEGTPSRAATATSLEEFAHRVEQTARQCTSGRFGHDKVFISHVWKRLQPELGDSSVDEFKRRLAEANRLGLVSLSRADLVQAMNPDDVRESETEYLNARFHFVRVR